MEPEQTIPTFAQTPKTETCPVCHQPIKPEYFFCPNCGAKLHAPPLSVTPLSQALLYAFSIILPWIVFIFITRWQGIKYLQSEDPTCKKIGAIATALLVLSTILTFWIAYVTLTSMVQSQIAAVNADLNF